MLVPKASKVCVEMLAKMVRRVLKVFKEMPDLKAHKVYRVQLEQTEPMVHKVFRESKVCKGFWVLKESKVFKDNLYKVFKVCRECRVQSV